MILDIGLCCLCGRFRGAKAEAELIRARLRELEERRRVEPATRRGDIQTNGSPPNSSAPKLENSGSAMTTRKELEHENVRVPKLEAINSHDISLLIMANPSDLKDSGTLNRAHEDSLRSSLAAEAARIRAEVEAARQRAEAADRELAAAHLVRESESKKMEQSDRALLSLATCGLDEVRKGVAHRIIGPSDESSPTGVAHRIISPSDESSPISPGKIAVCDEKDAELNKIFNAGAANIQNSVLLRDTLSSDIICKDNVPGEALPKELVPTLTAEETIHIDGSSQKIPGVYDEKDSDPTESYSVVKAGNSVGDESNSAGVVPTLKSMVDVSIAFSSYQTESDANPNKLVTFAHLPDEVTSSQSKTGGRDSAPRLPDADLCAGLVEWAQELGLTMISPVVTNAAIPAAASQSAGSFVDIPFAASALDETYADESFEKDDEAAEMQRNEENDASQVDESCGLSVTSVKVWADSGPEVFEFPSGAGEILDDSVLDSRRAALAPLLVSQKPAVDEALAEVRSASATAATKCGQESAEGEVDLTVETQLRSVQAETQLCQSQVRNIHSQQDLGVADAQLNEENSEEIEPRKTPPKVHQTWYAVFDDDEAAESAADEAASYFSEKIMSLAVSKLIREAAAEAMASMETVDLRTSPEVEASIPEADSDLRVSAALASMETVGLRTSHEVEASSPEADSELRVSSAFNNLDTDETDVDGSTSVSEAGFSLKVPPWQLCTLQRGQQEEICPRASADEGQQTSQARQNDTMQCPPASKLCENHQLSTVNPAQSVLLPEAFFVGPARSEDPNHPLRFQRPPTSESGSSLSVLDSVDTTMQAEAAPLACAGAGRLGACEADALLSSVEAAVRALRVARASSSGPAVSAVVQALREAQGRISQVLAAVSEDCPTDANRNVPPVPAAARAAVLDGTEPAAEGPSWPPPSSGLPSARSSFASGGDGGCGGREQGKNKLNVSLSSISGAWYIYS